MGKSKGCSLFLSTTIIIMWQKDWLYLRKHGEISSSYLFLTFMVQTPHMIKGKSRSIGHRQSWYQLVLLSFIVNNL